MKVLILGSSGQLGQDISKELKKNNFETIAPVSSEVDVTKNLDDISAYDFNCLINCSSYHKVDELEDNIEKAFRVNSLAIEKMAKICKSKDAIFFTFSTDYVHGDNKSRIKILEEEVATPLNIYGLSKLYGENLALNQNKDSVILRVASLFGEAGSSGKGGNFVESIIKASNANSKIEVVGDQVMSPTSTSFVAKTIIKMIQMEVEGGIYNLVCEGEVSWYKFATDIIKRTGNNCKVEEIKAQQLKQNALRPAYSALSTSKIKKLGIKVPTYLTELEEYLKLKGHT